MASSSSSMAEKISPKPIVFKYQGAPRKSYFQDVHVEIKDTELRHIDWNDFLIICSKPKERFAMVSSLMHSGLVNVVSHLVLVQSSEFIRHWWNTLSLKKRLSRVSLEK